MLLSSSIRAGLGVLLASSAAVLPAAPSRGQTLAAPADPLAGISAHTSAAEDALRAGSAFLAEHRARRALALAYTALGRLDIDDGDFQKADDALALGAARAPGLALDARALLHGLRAARGDSGAAL
ncbi:MAG: hypothetical protein AAFX50_08750, partial [Acidobacteriota bacterium]